MTRLLAVETSSEACSVALSFDGSLLRREFHEPRRHAELLLPSIRQLLAEGEMALGSLDAIAFGRGPGSFTSLRIGIGVVQGLAWGAGLGVVPVSSLAALALGAARHLDAPAGTWILAAVDARMGEVFHGCFEVTAAGLVEPRGAEQVSDPGAVTIPAAGRILGAGNGFARYPQLAEKASGLAAVLPDVWPSASDVATLAAHWLSRHPALPAHEAQPVYIRDDVAEKPALG